MRLLREALDLLLPLACAGCGQPGRPVCAACARVVAAAVPEPLDGGAVDPGGWCAGPYSGAVVGLVLAHKDRRCLEAGVVLGAAVATAVGAAVPEGPVVLVPVPSRPAAVRARGFDHARLLATHAAQALALAGRPVAVRPVLRAAGRVDQGRRPLDARGRGPRVRVAGRVGGPAVLVDDVATTGGSLRACAAALRAAGADDVRAAVAAAATRCRRRP